MALGAVASCARQGSPPGGPPDNLPPEVVATRPDTFAELEVVDDPIRIRFSERISEQPVSGLLDDAVLVSPRTGDVRVSHERDALEVDLSGGFEAGVVYRVTVLPVIRDMFGNALAAPFEFVFSTGGEYHPNAVAGLVIDRITGQRVEGADVVARPEGADTLDPVYVSRTDTSGIYALRYLPPGRYQVMAFQDRNRDGRADPFEIQGQVQLPQVGVRDTVLADIVILNPDTSAARLAQAALEDSVRVALTFDDYLDPTASLEGVETTLEPVPDTTEEGVTTPPPPPPVERVLHELEFQAWQDSVARVRATADSLAAVATVDSLAAVLDSATAAGDSAVVAEAESALAAARAAVPRGEEAARPEQGAAPRGVAPPRGRPGAPGGGARPSALPDGTPLPSQRLILLLGSPIPPGTTYRVRISGVENVNGLGGGAGEALVSREALPPDTAAADTAGVPPDTGAVAPPHTGVAPPDTGAALPDAGARLPDTGAVASRDTGAPPVGSGLWGPGGGRPVPAAPGAAFPGRGPAAGPRTHGLRPRAPGAGPRPAPEHRP